MARGRSVIEVAIIGDVKNLQTAFGKVDALSGGAATSLLKLGAGFLSVRTAFDFIDDSLGKFDDFNDAST